MSVHSFLLSSLAGMYRIVGACIAIFQVFNGLAKQCNFVNRYAYNL